MYSSTETTVTVTSTLHVQSVELSGEGDVITALSTCMLSSLKEQNSNETCRPNIEEPVDITTFHVTEMKNP